MAMLLGAGIIVKIVLFLLLLFSLISWAIILFKWGQVRRARLESGRFLALFWQTGRFDAIAAQLDSFSNSPLGVLFREGYDELRKLGEPAKGGERTSALAADPGGVENVGRALRRATNAETTRLEKYLTFLATTGSTSPFVGLFGTVWGIMTAFEGIGLSGSASLAVVAPGIAEALIATAVGLVAAIPAVMAFNHFQSRIRGLINEMEGFSTEFLNIVQRRKVGGR